MERFKYHYVTVYVIEMAHTNVGHANVGAPNIVEPECIYIATRLTAAHPIDYLINFKQSLKLAAEVWRKGHIPFVPGLDFLLYLEMDGNYGLGGRSPYPFSMEWLRRSDSILVGNGYLDEPKSAGVNAEVMEAILLNKKIYMALDEIKPVNVPK